MLLCFLEEQTEKSPLLELLSAVIFDEFLSMLNKEGAICAT